MAFGAESGSILKLVGGPGLTMAGADVLVGHPCDRGHGFHAVGTCSSPKGSVAPVTIEVADAMT